MVDAYRTTARQLVIENRVKELVFGFYAWTEETTTVDEAGSGILVSPGLALTAKHVTKSFSKLDSQMQAKIEQRTPLDSQYRRIIMVTFSPSSGQQEG